MARRAKRTSARAAASRPASRATLAPDASPRVRIIDAFMGLLAEHSFERIGLADIAIASFFRNGSYAGFNPDPARWPRTADFVALVLGHPAFHRIYNLEMIQLSASIEGRRQALLDAGARLTEETYGQRVPRKGVMRL